MNSIQRAAAGAIRSTVPTANTARQNAAAAISAKFDAQRAALAAEHSTQLEAIDAGRRFFQELQEAFA